MSTYPLYIKQPNGRYAEAPRAVICEAAARYFAEPLKRGDTLNSPKATREFLQSSLAHLDHEVFMVLLLDNRHRLIEAVPLFRGTIDGASVHPREVVKLVLQHSAAAVVFAHNHPSGNPEPSQSDETITTRLREALALIDARTLDHIIVAGDRTVSFAERGLI